MANLERDTLGFLLRDDLPAARVVELVASALGLPADQVSVLDYEADQSQLVLLQLVHRERGFITDVTAFVEKGAARGLDSLGLAQRVATVGGVDVLVSPPAVMAASPSAWILVTATGERFVVPELEPGAADVVVIDDSPEARRRL